MSIIPALAAHEETPPQLIGEFKPVDEWQVHINALFYGLRGGRVRDYYQTMASADYRLAHALAVDYHAHTTKQANLLATLVIQEWGCGNGNLAACFLTHLKALDSTGAIYRKTRYVLVDANRDALQAALAHPDLQAHRDRVIPLQADAQDLSGVKDGSVHWIHCNELWNELRTKVILRKEGEIVEEQVRPNLSDAKTKEFDDWSAFLRAFEARDIAKLKGGPSFLDEIIWERDYQPIDWKRVPYRKTISDFMKQIDELVIVPANFGAVATIKEAQRLLAPGGRFTSLDAGTPEKTVLSNPDKPCYGLHGGQYSFIVNFALCDEVARHLGITEVAVEPQREFASRVLGVTVLTMVDLLETHLSWGRLKPWDRDRLVLKTLKVLDIGYRSPYQRAIDFPIRTEIAEPQRQELQGLLESLPQRGVPDTIAYLSEEEVLGVITELDALGFERARVQETLAVGPRRDIDYYRFSFVQK
ncbi:MAG: class I SAM-dependent methyltransferase [Nitrospirae bacterium]|nr:MAG: class I SAM-dependent methyltransferase [Nitrospirota bacterium]